MVLVTSDENRNGEREVFAPPGKGSMAHRSYLSPDGKWVLTVWLGGEGWEPCRLVPFDGSSSGKPVGPPDRACTSAGWSPDGQWIYLSSEAGGRFHIWRQRFPDGPPEQITSGVIEEEGVAVAPDGKSLITSVGNSESAVWVHDENGDHQITSVGNAYFVEPDASGARVFSPDGKRLYYLMDRRLKGQMNELWSTELATGKSQQVVAEAELSGYDVSPDGGNVAYRVASKDGGHAIYLARVDHLLPPRQLSEEGKECCPLFASNEELVFMATEGEESFLYRVKTDGSERRKVYEQPVVALETVSPDGRYAVVQAEVKGEDVPRGIFAIPLDGGTPVRICSGLCVVRWSMDGKSLFLSVVGGSHGHSFGWGTFIVPLAAGQMLPKLPPRGVASKADAEALPGARPTDLPALPGLTGKVYAYARQSVHRNLFRIPLL